MNFVWADGMFDEMVIDEWVVEAGFNGTVRASGDAVTLSAIVRGEHRERTCPRTRDLRECLTTCRDALYIDARHPAFV